MSDELVIKQLKDRETQLMNDLNKVRLALQAFIGDNIGFANNSKVQYPDDLVPKSYSDKLTYSSKVLYVLNMEKRPMLVDEIVASIAGLEVNLDVDKLHKNVSYNLSMLARYSKIKKHPFNRKIKYSLY